MINIAVAVIKDRVLAQILDMPRELRGTGTIFYTPGFDIYSYNCPELELNRIYLWGNNTDEDNKVRVKTFRTNSDAMKYAKKLCDTIDKYNHEHGYNKDIKIETETAFFSDNKPTNQKLSFEIILWGNILIMKNTDIKTADRGVKEVNTNDFKLLSVDHPQLESLRLLYVRGTNKELDNTVMVTHFNSLEKMQQYVECLKKATKVWNDNNDDEVKVFSYIPIA